jgi:hypothetical protein
MSSLHQEYAFRRVPHQTHAYCSIFMADLNNMTTTRFIHVVPILMHN